MAEKVDVQAMFASNASRIRKEAGLTQKKLAEKAGLTHNFVNDLENGKKWFSAETLSRLAEAAGVEPMEYFINLNQWNDIERKNYILLLNSLNKRVNKLFEECLEEETQKLEGNAQIE